MTAKLTVSEFSDAAQTISVALLRSATGIYFMLKSKRLTEGI